MNKEEFRALGHALVDWVADYRENLADLPVMSPLQPGAIKSQYAAAPPQQGGALSAQWPQEIARLLPGITHWNHPRFFAYFPSNTSLASVLADIVISGLGAQCMSWQTSPAATELEEVVMDWLRQMVGLPETFTGVIQDTASNSTFTALLCARERSTNFCQHGQGLQAHDKPLVVYASDQAHSSVWKAGLLAGFGDAHIRLIETDNQHALNVKKLSEAIETDKAAGLQPCAIVASCGTTGTTALDPIEKIAAIAREHDCWLHVDAALAGSAMICPENRWLWAGVEHADSLVFNPHKWLGVGFDFSAYYIRDSALLQKVMATSPSYLKTQHDDSVKNYRDWGIPLGRRFRSLKLYFLLLDQGVSGLQQRIRRDLDNAQWLKRQVQSNNQWQLMAPVSLQTVCVRHVPARIKDDEAALTEHNLAIAKTINDSGRAYLTPSVLKGKQILRLSVGSEATERADVEALWMELGKAAMGQ